MKRQPLFRVVKREGGSPARQALAYAAAVALALLAGALLLLAQGVDPVDFYGRMITLGIPGSRYPWRTVENFVKLFVPLLIVSLALSLAFKMRFWNIGGGGAFPFCAPFPSSPGKRDRYPIYFLIICIPSLPKI